MFIEFGPQYQKRKGPSSSGVANSTGTGNIIGPDFQPWTPSTHTLSDEAIIAPIWRMLIACQRICSCMLLYKNDGTGGLALSANQLVKELITSTTYNVCQQRDKNSNQSYYMNICLYHNPCIGLV